MTDDALPAKAKRRARETLDTARHAAIDAAGKTAQAIEGNPMSVLVGGLAVGLIAGALIPRAKTEQQLLGPVSTKLRQGTKLALRAARDAGLSELASAGISRMAVREQVGKLIDAVGQAATRAGEAATSAARSGRGDAQEPAEEKNDN